MIFEVLAATLAFLAVVYAAEARTRARELELRVQMLEGRGEDG